MAIKITADSIVEEASKINTARIPRGVLSVTTNGHASKESEKIDTFIEDCTQKINTVRANLQEAKGLVSESDNEEDRQKAIATTDLIEKRLNDEIATYNAVNAIADNLKLKGKYFATKLSKKQLQLLTYIASQHDKQGSVLDRAYNIKEYRGIAPFIQGAEPSDLYVLIKPYSAIAEMSPDKRVSGRDIERLEKDVTNLQSVFLYTFGDGGKTLNKSPIVTIDKITYGCEINGYVLDFLNYKDFVLKLHPFFKIDASQGFCRVSSTEIAELDGASVTTWKLYFILSICASSTFVYKGAKPFEISEENLLRRLDLDTDRCKRRSSETKKKLIEAIEDLKKRLPNLLRGYTQRKGKKIKGSIFSFDVIGQKPDVETIEYPVTRQALPRVKNTGDISAKKTESSQENFIPLPPASNIEEGQILDIEDTE